MSESLPREEGPVPPTEDTPEVVGHAENLDAVAAQNTVEPTPEAPQEQIREARERVARHAPRQRATQSSSGGDTAPPTREATHSGGSHHHGGSLFGKVFSGGYGILGWFFIHVVWQGLTKWHTMAKGGGKSSAPAKSGGDHH